jgi:hypothetical protein
VQIIFHLQQDGLKETSRDDVDLKRLWSAVAMASRGAEMERRLEVPHEPFTAEEAWAQDSTPGKPWVFNLEEEEEEEEEGDGDGESVLRTSFSK